MLVFKNSSSFSFISSISAGDLKNKFICCNFLPEISATAFKVKYFSIVNCHVGLPIAIDSFSSSNASFAFFISSLIFFILSFDIRTNGLKFSRYKSSSSFAFTLMEYLL